MARLRALMGADYGELTAGKGLCLKASLGRAATPSEEIEKSAGGGAFPGSGFQYSTSILQECIYSRPAYPIVFGRIGIPVVHENSLGMR